MSSVDQNFEEILKEEIAKIDPATLLYLEQFLAGNAPAVRKIVQNVLDEPISQETEKRLLKPLLPKPSQPRPPLWQRKEMGWNKVHDELDGAPERTGLCVACFKNKVKHYLVVEREDVYEFEETFIKYW